MRLGNVEIMHAAALNHMKLSIDLYLHRDRHYDVLDFGSRSQVGGESHRQLFDGYDVKVVGVDVVAGPNVDLVMRKPYRIPMKSNSVDVAMSGQAFEHIPFFWASFLELCRVVKPGGLIFLTAPSRGHVHFDMDCWRYYPDSMRALAAIGRVRLLEAHTDLPPRLPGSRRLDYAAIDSQRAYWGDTVGVFRKPQHYSRLVAVARAANVWWANRVGGIEHIGHPKPRRRRRRVTSAARGVMPRSAPVADPGPPR